MRALWDDESRKTSVGKKGVKTQTARKRGGRDSREKVKKGGRRISLGVRISELRKTRMWRRSKV